MVIKVIYAIIQIVKMKDNELISKFFYIYLIYIKYRHLAKFLASSGLTFNLNCKINMVTTNF